MFRKILLALLGVVVVAVAVCVAFVASRQNLTFDAPFPAVAASTDSAVIARGHYVVRTVSNCASCHGDTTQAAVAAEGAEGPLSGGLIWDIPPGKFYTRNITPDDETGLGRIPDGAIARALRNGIGHDGRALLPFMEMQGLSDEDLVAVVSYLRAQPPVRNPVPMHQYTTLGKVLKATLFSKPTGPRETPPVTNPRGPTVENGRYLVESVALCWACHTQRDMQTGQLTGPRFGGAKAFEVKDGKSWSPPNITTDPTTGKLAAMTEDEFITRFRAGRLLPGSPMPWQGLMHMDEDDLRAMYRYLKTVPAVNNDVGPPVMEVAK